MDHTQYTTNGAERKPGTHLTMEDRGAIQEYLCVLPLDNNNAVFNLCCRLCSAYERKSFLDGLQYGAELILELGKEAAR